MRRYSLVGFIEVGIVAVLLLSFAGAAVADSRSGLEGEGNSISIIVGRSRLLEFDGLIRTAVGNPQVADVAVISGKELLLNAKSPGKTTLHVWDRKGVSVYLVQVGPDEVEITGNLKELIGLPGVSVRVVGDVILLEGSVESPEEKARAEEIAKVYSGKVLSFISVAPAVPQKTVEVVVEVIRGIEKSATTLREVSGKE